MKLSRAACCMDCDEVFDDQEHDYCPVCGGRATHPATRWLRPLSEAAECILHPDRIQIRATA